jgi:hypothetical protein
MTSPGVYCVRHDMRGRRRHSRCASSDDAEKALWDKLGRILVIALGKAPIGTMAAPYGDSGDGMVPITRRSASANTRLDHLNSPLTAH